MELGTIFLLLFVLVIVVLFVFQPFIGHWRTKTQSSQAVSALLTERERTLTDLLELDFDKEIGKIPFEEYSVQRASLVQKGSEILLKLDEVRVAESSAEKKSRHGNTVEQNSGLLSDEDLEDLIARRRQMRQQTAAGFCPNCGKPIFKTDQFCPSCGYKMYKKAS